MTNKEWEKYLRDVLGDYKSEGPDPSWDEFARQFDETPSPEEPPEEYSSMEDQLQSSLAEYKAPGEVEGWERIEASLEAANQTFDENVRKKIDHYQPPFDPLSWTVFLRHFSRRKLLRAKLIALKTVEFAAIILFLLTVANLGRMGKLNFDTPPDKDTFENTIQPVQPDKAYIENKTGSRTPLALNNSEAGETRPHAAESNNSNALATAVPTKSNISRPSPENITKSAHHKEDIIAYLPGVSVDPIPADDYASHSQAVMTGSLPEIPASVNTFSSTEDMVAMADPHPIQENYITGTLASLDIHLSSSHGQVIPGPKFVKQLHQTFLEFGIITQADYNRLRMPEDRLYSAGKQIVFPQQGIPSHGFGAGFTIGIGHPVWALETGIIYSEKDFKPGRQLIVGGAFDNGSVEFESMRLQLISVPIQYRYRFANKGRLKTYALAGLGLHVISQSDIDVLIKYHFPSLSAGENPNNDPYFAETIRETRRISEHIRDGAPFSTKSFFSANAGLGLEYTLTPHKTLFLQSAFQYQIPNIKFSNNNGKHIRSISLQAGVRTPLGS